MKTVHSIRVSLFVVAIFFGIFFAVCIPPKPKSDMENRELAQLPQFTLDSYFSGDFQEGYDSYLNDQFMFRDNLVNVSSMIKFCMGFKEINDVYIGKNGYLLEKSTEKYDASSAKENIKILSKFLNDMERKYGEEHVSCMMIPLKAECLTNKLPEYAQVNDRTEILDKLRKKLNSEELLIDLKECLSDHNDEYIYYRTDYHWTTLGAYYAYIRYCEKMGLTPNELSHYDKQKTYNDFYGTTYNKAHVNVEKDYIELFRTGYDENITVEFDGEKYNSMYFFDAASDGFDRYSVFFSKNTFLIDVYNNDKSDDKGTLLLIKDSFANSFVPFMLAHYNRIIMIDYRYGRTAIGNILEENDDISDVLVLFNTDKFLENTKLSKLADTYYSEDGGEIVKENTLEEFDPSMLFEDSLE